MITEILGLAGSGALGSMVGIVSDIMQGRRETKLKEVELEIARRAKENGQTLDFLKSETGFVTSPFYGFSFMLLCFTYCSCAIICFLWPNIPLHTFNPGDEPRVVSVLFGPFSYTFDPTKVYTISTGGVGYGLLHPLAFQIGTVITGINPMKRG